MLVEAGADLLAKDFDLNTPLHDASQNGHADIIIYLIKEAGVEPIVKNKFGYTPCDIAHDYKIRELFFSLAPNLKQES